MPEKYRRPHRIFSACRSNRRVHLAYVDALFFQHDCGQPLNFGGIAGNDGGGVCEGII